MSRAPLSVGELAEIAALLPSLGDLEGLVRHLDCGVLSTAFPHQSPVPIAAVAFADAYQTLTGVRYALHEFHAHGRSYRGLRPPKEDAAVFFERYYLEDAAFRLYNAAEDAADAIRMMLEISQADLRPYREKRSSLQAQVGAFLIASRPDDPMAAAVRALIGTAAWGEAMKFRNDAVHQQAQSVAGLGLVYERRQRWEQHAAGWTLPLGGGDQPRWKVGELGKTIDSAARGLITFVIASAEAYWQILAQTGRVRIDDTGISVVL